MTELWDTFFFNPMLNGLLLLYQLLFSNFGLAIIAFTIVVRLVMLPLTLKQLRASKQMAALQPKIAELQKRYKNDREALSKATMELYKEHGVNPLGCAGPTLIQFPIWIALYQSIYYALSDRPEGLVNLAWRIHPMISDISLALPLNNVFLGLNLNTNSGIIMAIIVAGTMWIQQRMMTQPSTDPQQAQMNQMMQWMMPIMFGYFTITFPSGLAVYWITSNIISIVLQYFVTGWGQLFESPFRAVPVAATVAPQSAPATQENQPARESQGRRGKRKR